MIVSYIRIEAENSAPNIKKITKEQAEELLKKENEKHMKEQDLLDKDHIDDHSEKENISSAQKAKSTAKKSKKAKKVSKK